VRACSPNPKIGGSKRMGGPKKVEDRIDKSRERDCSVSGGCSVLD